MIFVLDLILALNLFIALKVFRNLASPPILVGAGMLAASIIATSYYNEWELEKMLPISVFIIGCGTLFFTFCCVVYSWFCKPFKFKSNLNEINVPVKKVKIFILFSIIIGCLGILLKLYYLKQTFGSLGISELIVAKRIDELNGTNDFYLPSYVRQFGSYTTVVSNFTIWLLSLMACCKNNNIKKIRKILYCHIIIILVDGMLSGSKAPILNMFMQFGVFALFNYYASRGSFHLSHKVYLRFLIVFVLLALSFRGLNLLIGRSVEDRTNMDLLAEYCGAEIKNFDIYMHSSGVDYKQKWGENTFYSLHKELDPDYDYSSTAFQYVGKHSLGNVYTQYQPFHQDWGMPGVFLMSLIIALISMFFYEKAKKSIKSPLLLNVNLFIYTSMAMSLFMAFFSSKFTESIMRLGWLRTVVYLCVMVWFLQKFVLTYKNIKDGKVINDCRANV